MLPLILAGLSMAGQAQGQNQANTATVEGAQTQARIEGNARDLRHRLQDQTSAMNKPYYDAGIAQLPTIAAMATNPNFNTTSPEFGDKYSLGALGLLQQSMTAANHNGRPLVSLSELSRNFNQGEQERLRQRKMDLLRIGYGQANTAGNSLMNTGDALAQSSSRIGQIMANARQANAQGQQRMANDLYNGASYVPLYAYQKQQNEQNYGGFNGR